MVLGFRGALCSRGHRRRGSSVGFGEIDQTVAPEEFDTAATQANEALVSHPTEEARDDLAGGAQIVGDRLMRLSDDSRRRAQQDSGETDLQTLGKNPVDQLGELGDSMSERENQRRAKVSIIRPFQ